MSCATAMDRVGFEQCDKVVALDACNPCTQQRHTAVDRSDRPRTP